MDENLDAEETIDNNRNEMGGEDLNQNRDGQDESHDLMENHDMGPDGYRDDRIKEMYDFTNQNYDRNTQEWKEAAYQQYQNLEKQKNNYLNELNSLPNDQSSLRTRMDLEDKIHNINWQLNNDLGPDLGDYKSSFRGFNGNNDFDDAFASFNTDVQGNKDPNIQGDCGIISSQNVANQQLGTHGSELDGINHMRNLHDENGNSRLDETGKPSENGATGFDDRKAFLNSKGIDIEDQPSKPLHRIDLNDMSSRFQNGDSCMLRIKGSDLSQPELANRTERVYNPNSGKIENVKNNFSNHSVTVAGFTHDDKGNCTGIYVNDTGRFTPSNRVYISADKFNQMQKNTKGFGVEYCRRH